MSRAKRYGNRQVFVEDLNINGITYKTWQGDASMKRAFGLRPADKWPDEGMPARIINGIRVYIAPKGFVHMRGLKRRCCAVCPTCGNPYDAGHLGQHMAIHN